MLILRLLLFIQKRAQLLNRTVNAFLKAVMEVLLFSVSAVSTGGSALKNLLATQEMWVQSLAWEDPLEKEMEMVTTPVFLPGEFHGQRSLVGYSA